MAMEGMKLLTADEKQKLVADAQLYEASVYFKFPHSAVFKSHASSASSKKTIICDRPSDLSIVNTGKTATLNFVINSEIYFLVAVVNIDARKLQFSVDTDVFHLSRRQNRRIKMPKDFEANWMIKRLGGQMAFLRGVMTELSEGGCRLALNTETPLVQTDQILEGTLKIQDRLPIEVQGVVRFHKFHVRKEHKQIFGVEFIERTDSAKKMIKATVLDLEREFFLRILE